MTIILRFDEADSRGKMLGKLQSHGIEEGDRQRMWVRYRPEGLGTFMHSEIIHLIPINGGIRKIDASIMPGLDEPVWIVLGSGTKDVGQITNLFHQDYAKLVEEYARIKNLVEAQQVAKELVEKRFSEREKEIVDEQTERLKKLKQASGFGMGYPELPFEKKNVILE